MILNYYYRNNTINCIPLNIFTTFFREKGGEKTMKKKKGSNYKKNPERIN